VGEVHVSELEALDPSRLDPSLAVCMYFRDKLSFDAFYTKHQRIIATKKARGVRPLFELGYRPMAMPVLDEKWMDGEATSDDGPGTGGTRRGWVGDDDDDDDDFVFV
jgi:hypothetical protein